MQKRWLPLAGLLLVSSAVILWGRQSAQPEPSPPADKPAVIVLGKTPPLHLDSAESLYLRLRSVGLDKSRVFQARNVSIDKAAFHITLEDGTIAFTEDVAGRVTGAFFEGEGEVLLSPPNQFERASMALFTGGAILEERFATAYFRFSDDTFAELRPSLRPAEDPQAFLSQWNQTALNLAEGDALRLLMTFSKFLPDPDRETNESAALPASASNSASDDDHFLHVRLQGKRLGVFDLHFDSTIPEQILAGQLRIVDGVSYYDIWTSFALPDAPTIAEAMNETVGEGGKPDAIAVSHYKIRAEIKPPTQIDAEALLQLEVQQGGQRAVLFELSRALQIKRVEADGQSVEFIHNQAVEGTQLARHGNDMVAVVFPHFLRTGQKVELRFVYGGEVLSEAGKGLLYVGERGTWYPNRGLMMSNFDLEFHYPAGWTLIATGKRTDMATPSSRGEAEGGGASPPGEQVSRWVSERPIPIAGFDLGKFERGTARAGDVTVEAYATPGVERGFPKPRADGAAPSVPTPGEPTPLMVTSPSPARNAQAVAAASAHAIEFYSQRFGPYPYTDLKLAQMPGQVSQGWPGLVFLSSFSFLTGEEKSALHLNPVDKILISQVVGHETAHQWWGDLVMWSGYRDQWIVEALANYSSLMVLEAQNPMQFHAALERYRDDLLQKNQAGVPLMQDGSVTLGTRLSCSHFPKGYEAISYGRGTWLFHMLRNMLRDAERTNGDKKAGTADEPFVRVLRRIRERYQGKPITTRELLQAFEENLPRSLWFEHRKSLDWFYQGWVNGTAIPRFELRGVKYSDKTGATTVSGVILQKDAPDNLVTSVPLYATVAGKMVFLAQVFADGPETHFQVSASPGTRRVVLDPEETLLARPR
jgi:peptidase M1-like protein